MLIILLKDSSFFVLAKDSMYHQCFMTQLVQNGFQGSVCQEDYNTVVIAAIVCSSIVCYDVDS